MLMDKRQLDRAAGRLSRRHVAAGVTALLLSLLLHGLLLYMFGNVRFWVLPERLREFLTEKPIKMLEVRTEEIKEPVPQPKPGTEAGPVSDRLGENVDQVRPPSEAALQPPPPSEKWLAGDSGSVAEPTATPQKTTWEPRREIIAIQDRKASEETAVIPRREATRIDRFSDARDIVVPMKREDIGRTSPMPGGSPLGDPLALPQGYGSPVLPPRGGHTLRIGEPASVRPEKVLTEDEKKASGMRPIETLLTVEVTTYTTSRDPEYGYFRMDIKRAGAEILPVLPKDIVLVQDASASIAEQKMYFCRDALTRGLAEVRPGDRFNVMEFREMAGRCFTNWAEATPENLDRARQFVAAMKTRGETDIFASSRSLLELERQPGRPTIALIVSDGRPTSGLLSSSDIIGEFSKLNNGAISVFTFGTLQTANAYLLDLLSYCNRGNTHTVQTGRWGIPEEFLRLMKGLSRPVLSDVRFIFGTGSGCEVYPVLTENLYLDQALVLRGRYPRRTDRLIFQASGQGGEVKCDMIFDMSLSKAKTSDDREIRTDWAKQKIYHLIGQNARRYNPATLAEILQTARQYHIEVPYKRQL